MTAGDLDIVKSKLLDQIEAVCKWLLPEGKPEGDLWVSFNPVEHDYKPGRLPALKVRIRRGDIGAWKCWRCGVSGDVIKLIAYVLKTDTSGALKEARDFLGIQKMTRAEREQLRRVEAEKKVRRDEDAEKARLRKLQDADRLFNAAPSSKPIGPALVPHGTAAFGAGSDAELHAQHYFAARNVPIDQLFGRYTFRFSPATEWWKGQSWKNEGGRRWIDQRGPLFPAVHSAMRAWNGIVTCCHVTFLDPVKPDKAPVQPAKMVWGGSGLLSPPWLATCESFATASSFTRRNRSKLSCPISPPHTPPLNRVEKDDGSTHSLGTKHLEIRRRRRRRFPWPH